MMPITPKQQRILSFITGYISSNKQSPTMAEIGRAASIRSSATVHAHLANLERAGFIKRIPNISRGIRIAEQENQTATPSLPAAGNSTNPN